MKIYWLENLSFGNMVAVRCVREDKSYFLKLTSFRMFITYKTYDDLLPYNPFGNTTGPWRIKGDQHQQLEDVKKMFSRKRIDLEFMFGELHIKHKNKMV